MVSGPIQIHEIVEALRLLGGTAQAKHIKDKVTELRGGMPSHYGRSHSYRETIQKQIEDHCPQSANWRSTNTALFERIDRGVYRLYGASAPPESAAQALAAQVRADLEALAEEENTALEGGKSARLVSYFERNAGLRAAAIAHHGLTCVACGFNFGRVYGEHGASYIEVHHLVLVSTLLEPASVNPMTDMTVLCSNCHRMIHRQRDAPLSLEQLRGAALQGAR